MDIQKCELQFTFAGYKSNEVFWKDLNFIIDVSHSDSTSWTLIENASIRIINEKIIIHGANYSNVQKVSKLNIRVKVKRNPISAFYYVVCPTMAITFFNIVAYIIPSGEGLKLISILYCFCK